MSPGPNTQSWVGWNWRSNLIATSSLEGELRQRPTERDAGVDLPAAVALALQQEHVVVVDVRADRAASGGEADHHVVDAPARQEAELFEQRGHVRIPAVHVLDQQGPVVVGQPREILLWNGPVRTSQRPLARSRLISRASTPSSQASPVRSSGISGAWKPGKALRISRGRLCQ